MELKKRATVWLAIRILLGALVAAVLVAACAGAGVQTPSGRGRAGLLIIGPDGKTESRCVDFAGQTLSGRALLEQSGLSVTLDDRNAMGALVCSINGQGCSYPSQTCFCKCEDLGSCSYWAYFVRTSGGPWSYSTQGASGQIVQDGDLNAWIWLASGADAAGRLPDTAFSAVCP